MNRALLRTLLAVVVVWTVGRLAWQLHMPPADAEPLHVLVPAVENAVLPTVAPPTEAPPSEAPPPPPRPPIAMRRRARARKPARAAAPPPPAAEPALRTAPFPVLMLAHGRPARLNATLASLLAVGGLDRSQVFVVQDGHDERVSALVRRAGLRLVPSPDGRGAPTGDEAREGDGTPSERGERVSQAYRSALTHAFDVLTDDEALIVVVSDGRPRTADRSDPRPPALLPVPHSG